jgi:putative LysE/RhtB family amino acid efflux pump
MGSLFAGFGLGFFVALQFGPMSLLLMRATLRAGWVVGLAVGAGIATIDGLYASVGALGAAPALEVEPVRIALGAAGAVLLVVLGVRNLWGALHVRLGGETAAEVATPARAFRLALAGTASNPATIISWSAIFAAAATAGAARTSAGAALLVAGVALGSLSWVSLLASGMAVARRRIGTRAQRAIDVLAGIGLIGFGGTLAYATAEHR